MFAAPIPKGQAGFFRGGTVQTDWTNLVSSVVPLWQLRYSCDYSTLHRLSGEQLADHLLLLDAGEPLVQSLELVREPLVVDAQAVQDRCVEIVDVHGLVHHVVAEVVRLAVDHAALDAAAGQPHAEIAGMVIPAIVGLSQCELAV